MPIVASVENELSQLNIEGPVKVIAETHTVYSAMSGGLQKWLSQFPDKPLKFSKQPEGFSVVVEDPSVPGGITIADEYVVYPPVDIQPYPELPMEKEEREEEQHYR